MDKKLIQLLVDVNLCSLNDKELCCHIVNEDFKIVGIEKVDKMNKLIHDNDWGFNLYNTGSPRNIFVFVTVEELLAFATLSGFDNFLKSLNKSLYLSMDGYSNKMVDNFVKKFKPKNVFICSPEPPKTFIKPLKNKGYILLVPKKREQWKNLKGNVRESIIQEVI